MLYSRELIDQFPVRKSKKQKAAFREAALRYGAARGYTGTVEPGAFGAKNIVFGNPDTAAYLVTAHYDTCARLPFPNFITPCHIGIYLLYQLLFCAVLLLIPGLLGGVAGALLRSPLAGTVVAEACFVLLFYLLLFGPANPTNANDNSSGVLTVLDLMAALPEAQRDQVCFVLFDLEEAGLWGSAAYRKAHRKSSQTQLVLNFDCVGDGDHILLFPKSKVKRDHALLERLKAAAGRAGKKTVAVWEGSSFYPSDQAQFPLGVGVAAMRKSRGGVYYLGRIHTKRDTILEEQNIILLREFVLTLLGQGNEKGL